MKKIALCMIALMTLAACQNKGEKVPALDLSNLDTSVAPGEDFYKYATHGWQEANPLGAEYARFGSFDQLRENNVTRLNDLFASMSTMETKKGSIEQKIVDLYKQGLDSTRLNNEGAAPLQKYIAEIQAIKDKKEFAQAVAKLHLEGEGGFFGAFVEADLMDSDSQILYISQGGLGIGDRDYYVKPENAALKEGYRIFLNKVLTLAGVENAQAVADNTVAVEDYL
ncbi:MAG: M13 family peptidase, partial [Bacteroidales bacterium]|nr:M13 family peptidase [Bacteroidales bacterium]